jgi:hypothetical protein
MNDIIIPKEPNQILLASQKYRNAGLSVLRTSVRTKCPCGANGMASSWKEFQSRIATEDEIASWFGTQNDWLSIGLACGKVSGNLELLDFDFKAEFLKPWKEMVDKAGFKEILRKCHLERTQNGGAHVVYRCVEPIQGNAKLASKRIVVPGPGKYSYSNGTAEISDTGKPIQAVREGDEWICYFGMIETRGEGGQFLAAPSPGYVALNDMLCSLPVLSASEQETFLGLARAMDEQRHLPKAEKKPSGFGHSDESPIKAWIRQAGPAGTIALLEKHGWTEYGTGPVGTWMTRPGKENWVSGTVYADGGFYCFTSSASPLEMEKGYDAFGVLKTLEYGGDWKATFDALGLRNNASVSCTYSRSSYEQETIEEKPAYLPPSADDVIKAISGSPLGTYVSEVCSAFNVPPFEFALVDAILLAGATMAQRRVQMTIGPGIPTQWTNVYALHIGRSGHGKDASYKLGVKALQESLGIPQLKGESGPALTSCAAGNMTPLPAAPFGLYFRPEISKLLVAGDPVSIQVSNWFLESYDSGEATHGLCSKGLTVSTQVRPCYPSCIILGQPDKMETALGGTGTLSSGFLARFLIGWEAPGEENLEIVGGIDCNRILQDYRVYQDMPLDTLLFRPATFKSRGTEYKNKTDFEDACWCRLKGDYAPRIALMLNPQVAFGTKRLTGDDMARAAIVIDYLFANCAKLSSYIHEEKGETARAKAERFIMEHPGCSDRDLLRRLSINVWTFEKDILPTLLARGSIRQENVGIGKRTWFAGKQAVSTALPPGLQTLNQLKNKVLTGLSAKVGEERGREDISGGKLTIPQVQQKRLLSCLQPCAKTGSDSKRGW